MEELSDRVELLESNGVAQSVIFIYASRRSRTRDMVKLTVCVCVFQL